MINRLIHYRKLTDRLEFFHKQTEGKIEYKIIDNEVEDDSLFDISEETLSKKKEYLKPYFNFDGHMPPITKPSERSVAVKQVAVWLECAKQEEPYFILEDDVIFTPNCFDFVEQISRIDNAWDIVMFGESCGLRAGDGLRQVIPPMTRGLSAYLIHPNFAKKIKDDISTISMAVDWELNYLTVKHECKMFWYEPILFGQGSQGGPFSSSIQGQ